MTREGVEHDRAMMLNVTIRELFTYLLFLIITTIGKEKICQRTIKLLVISKNLERNFAKCCQKRDSSNIFTFRK